MIVQSVIRGAEPLPEIASAGFLSLKQGKSLSFRIPLLGRLYLHQHKAGGPVPGDEEDEQTYI